MESECKGRVQGPKNNRHACAQHSSITLAAEPKRGHGFDLADGDEVLEMEEPQTWMLE